MDLTNLSTALFVKNIKVSKDFYCNILGLTISLDFGKNVIFSNGLAIWEIQENHIIPMKCGPDKISDSSVNRFELYLETEDIEEVYRYLLSRNVRFLHPINEEPWGQLTIRVFDPDSHLVEIGESLARFVRRFHDSGMSPEQVSQRTSVPLEEVERLISG